MKVFLGGTCADSTWRNSLIPFLKINYFNPVVTNWTPECQQEELKQREECDFLLYVITRPYSIYSIAEVVDDSNKRPNKTIMCIVTEKLKNGKLSFTKQDIKHLDAIGRMVQRNGAMYSNNLGDIIHYLNEGQRI